MTTADGSAFTPHTPGWIFPIQGWLTDGPPADLLPPPCVEEASDVVLTPFGADTKKEHFLYEDGWTFLNHGSYGGCLRAARAAQRHWQDRMEAQPIRWMESEVIPLLCHTNREVSKLLSVAPQDICLVPNASSAMTMVFNSLRLQEGDVCILLDMCYSSVRSALWDVCNRAGATLVEVAINDMTVSEGGDSSINGRIVAAVEQALEKHAGRVRFALFDHITSMPSVIMPVERLVAAVKAHGALCMIDGAHAVGAIDLDIPKLGADYYCTNFHKWLCTPKGSALLWVSPSCQGALKPLIYSHGYGRGFSNTMFWLGSYDYTAYLAITSALKVLNAFGLGKVRTHCHNLVCEAAEYLTSKWNTKYVGHRDMLTMMATVQIPTLRAPFSPADGPTAASALHFSLRNDHRVEVPVIFYKGSLWARVSAYLHTEMSDFERFAEVIESLR